MSLVKLRCVIPLAVSVRLCELGGYTDALNILTFAESRVDVG